MGLVYSISPMVDHYSCIVDLLGRSGNLHKAEDFIKTMPCEPDAAVWKALFNACRVHGNMEMGECAAKKVVKLHPENAARYLLLSTIYTAAGKWDLKANVQWQRMQRDIRDKDEFR
jgi:pentatricopeptide repeat protein